MFNALLKDMNNRNIKLWSGLALGMFLFQLMMSGIYESMAQYFVAGIFGTGELPAVFNVFTGGSNMFEPLGWLSTGYVHPVPIVIVMVWTILISSGSVAKEVEDGTGELLFSHPVSRYLILNSRILYWLAGLVGIIIAGVVGTVTGMHLGGGFASVSGTDLFELVFSLVPMLFLVAGLGFITSSAFSLRARSSSVATFFVVGSYFLNFAAQLWKPIYGLAKYSIFYHTIPGDWATNGIKAVETLVMIGVGVILMMLANLILKNRDIAS
jgi:ABC-type transport system involved in multi-copper enzyme maturation permease subunit